MSDEKPTPPEDTQSTETYASDPGTPQRIGNYRILQKIGEGGMGEVYLAEQEKPIRRRVALKLIKLGMDTKQVVARFESERQALAIMNHPNVAKVLDAGATDQGRPYFAMEYVKGEPITKYCNKHRLTTQERLKLFMQVCEGVQHAHQKGIIHRDIKASNVLVQVEGDKPVPKIIDFGVAKATDHRLTEKTVFTQMGVLIGTPEYMSPEQAEMTGLDIDTRTDIYSLGVLLYELLVGALPFDPVQLRRGGFDEIRRVIREDEPSKPSTRISTLGEASHKSAKLRRTDPKALARQLRGDLDWVTMKALEKDRTRRYRSVSEVSEDLGRHLRDEPILAGPPRVAYRARKFARRHKVGVSIAAAGLMMLLAFAGMMTYQANRIAWERDRANQEAETSRRVAEFLGDMLAQVEPEVLGQLLVVDLRERIERVQRKSGATEEEVDAAVASFGQAMRGVNATDAGLRLLDELVLARAGATIESQLESEPVVAAWLEYTIGRAYQRLGLFEQAERHSSRALYLSEHVLGDSHPFTLAAMCDLAILFYEQGRYDESEQLHLKTLQTRKHVLGEEHLDTLFSMRHLALLYDARGRYREAEGLHIQALEASKRILGAEHPDTLDSMHNLAGLYSTLGRYDEAERLFVKVLEIRSRVLGESHANTSASKSNLALLYQRQGRFNEAERLYAEVLEADQQVLGDTHPRTLGIAGNLASLYMEVGRFDEAERLYKDTIRIQRRDLGVDHPHTLVFMGNLAALHIHQGRYDESKQLLIETLEIQQQVLGNDHRDTLITVANLGVLFTRMGRYDDAEPLLLEAIRSRQSALGNDHETTLIGMYNLACLEARRGNTTAAMNWLRQAVQAGYAEADRMGEDADLSSLHGPEFVALVDRARENAAPEQLVE